MAQYATGCAQSICLVNYYNLDHALDVLNTLLVAGTDVNKVSKDDASALLMWAYLPSKQSDFLCPALVVLDEREADSGHQETISKERSNIASQTVIPIAGLCQCSHRT